MGMFGTTFILALREIRRHLMRSFLTTLGIIIGVSAVITMVTLGNGATASIKEQISSLGSNVFIVFPVQGDDGQFQAFKQDDVVAVREQIAGVTAAAGNVQQSVEAIHNGQNWASTVEGVSNAFMDARSVDLADGRRFTPEEEESGANVCIIGQKVYETIFVEGVSPIGERMRLNNVSCMVIGLADARSAGGDQDEDNTIMMPLKNVQRRFSGNDNLSYMVISYDPAYDPPAMQNALIGLLRERRLLLEDQNNNFNIIDTAQVNDAVSTAVGTLTAIVTAIAAISLVVGGVGIMNIMLVSVTERTREIGIRMAIGARAKEVRRQFLTEAVVLCCFGGLVGILLALGLSVAVAALFDIPFIFSPTINLISFGISALIGIIFGYFPARRAAALDPIEALRHE
jgi:putative ABC transport system permease protein